MGLLAVDVTAHGVVMSADSQPVEILGGENRCLAVQGRQTRCPIVIRAGGGFLGLVGFAGTEQVEGIETADWLYRFGAAWPTDDLGTYCSRLAQTLTHVWKRDGLRSVLEILVTGEIGGDVQFWFVRNSRGLREADWKHEPPASVFDAANDLDDNYISQDRVPPETKDDVLRRKTYSFRQGVLLPGAPVFSAFEALLQTMYAGSVEGFAPLSSLDDVGHFARVRLEFLKRLCSSKHGIYDNDTPSPIGGEVHVLGVGRDGGIRDYHKQNMRVRRPGRRGAGARAPTSP